MGKLFCVCRQTVDKCEGSGTPLVETYQAGSPNAQQNESACGQENGASTQEEKKGFDLRSRLKAARNNQCTALLTDRSVEPAAAVVQPDEAPMGSSGQRVGGLRDRLGKRRGVEAVASQSVKYSGVVTGVQNGKLNCWVLPDGEPPGTKHFLLYQDLPHKFEVSSWDPVQ